MANTYGSQSRKSDRSGQSWLATFYLLALLALLFLPELLPAQDYRAVISGQVTDPTGAAISGATVKAINIETHEVKEAKTTAQGSYSVPYLDPGVYDLEVSAQGFSTLKRERIVLRVRS